MNKLPQELVDCISEYLKPQDHKALSYVDQEHYKIMWDYSGCFYEPHPDKQDWIDPGPQENDFVLKFDKKKRKKNCKGLCVFMKAEEFWCWNCRCSYYSYYDDLWEKEDELEYEEEMYWRCYYN